MSITPGKFVRNSFEVEAVRVLPEIIAEIAEWCGGEVTNAEHVKNVYIKVPVPGAANCRQTIACTGDWVVKSAKGFRVLCDKSFRTMYGPIQTDEEKLTQVLLLVKEAMSKQDIATYHGQESAGMDLVSHAISNKILKLFREGETCTTPSES